MTRARRRVMVFSSFDPEDLRVEETSSVGVRDLRRYLELARDGFTSGVIGGVTGGVGPATATTARRGAVDRHRDDLAAALRAARLEVATAVGLSDFQVDLAVGTPGVPPALAVLLDSPAWAERRTTSDRDALPVVVLERIMGWPAVARVWLPAWLADRDAVVREVTEATRRTYAVPVRVRVRVVTTSTAPQDGDGGVAAHDIQDAPEVQDAPVPETTSPAAPGADPLGVDDVRPEVEEAFVPFVSDVVGRRSALDGLPHGRHTAPVQTLIRHIVDTEGPVSVPRLARLVARAHGLSRVLDDRVAQVARTVPDDLRRDAEEAFVWPPHRDPLRWEGYRRTTGPLKDRPLDDVAARDRQRRHPRRPARHGHHARGAGQGDVPAVRQPPPHRGGPRADRPGDRPRGARPPARGRRRVIVPGPVTSR